MDFFFDEPAAMAPSTSQSSPRSPHGDSHMAEDNDHGSSQEESSSVSMPQIQGDDTSSTINYISRRVEELVEKINCSRTNDQKVMQSFQEKLTEKVVQSCQLLKEHMYTVYERNSNDMQVKLQELTEVLESCTKLNTELLEASQALTGLREGLGISKALQSP